MNAAVGCSETWQVHLTSDAGVRVGLPEIRNETSVERAMFKLAQRIREEFEEAPDLWLTVREASQFWGLDEDTCQRVLARLLTVGFLAMDVNDRYGVALAADRSRRLKISTRPSRSIPSRAQSRRLSRQCERRVRPYPSLR